MGGRGVRGAGWRAGGDEGKVLTLLRFMCLFYNLRCSLPSSGMRGNRQNHTGAPDRNHERNTEKILFRNPMRGKKAPDGSSLSTVPAQIRCPSWSMLTPCPHPRYTIKAEIVARSMAAGIKPH